MTAAEFERLLLEKNDLRRKSGLPLYDVEKAMARFHAGQQEAAYADFVSAHLKPCTTAWDDEPPPASWSEAQARYGRYLRLRAMMLPEIEREWAERHDAGEKMG
jgi:hypothetical protein